MEGRKLTKEEAAQLLLLPESKTREKKPKPTIPEERTVTTWFTLKDLFKEVKCGFCDTKRMCVPVGDTMICRFCYLKGEDVNVETS